MVLSIPIWLLVCIVILIIGAVLFIRVGRDGGGDYDFFTPIVLFAILVGTVVAIVGILLGKFVF